MTKEEFEAKYCKESGITSEFYNEFFVTLPCRCNYEECEGWAAVTNHPITIKAHRYRNGDYSA